MNVGGSAPTSIPFMSYRAADLINEGPKFTYLPTLGAPEKGNVELVSYHIKCMYAISSGSSGSSSGFSRYLCTLVVLEAFSSGVFPGRLTGMLIFLSRFILLFSCSRRLY